LVDFSVLDWAVLAAFFVAVLALGFSAKLKENTSLQMVAAGRALTMPLFVATLITTWYGGVLATPEFYRDYGGLATLTFNGLPYWVAGILFAFFLAKRIRSEEQISIPERIERCYGRAAGLIAALIVMLLASPASYMLMLGTLLSTIFLGLPIWVGVLIGGLASTAFLYKGGLMADARSNTVAFVMMYAAFILILAISINRYGPPWEVIPNLPAEERKWDGGMGFFVVVSWMLIGTWTFVDPGFHQRVAAISSPDGAKRGVLIAVVFWIIFDSLTTFTAMYATIAMRGSDPEMMGQALFPAYGNAVLPIGIKGIFFAGMFGALIAATVGYTFVGGTTLSRDFFARLIKEPSEATITLFTRIGIAISAVAGIALAAFSSSAVALWYNLPSIAIPALLVPVLGAYAARTPPHPKTSLLALTIPPTVALLWLLNGARVASMENAIFGTESVGTPSILTPIIAGILVALLIWGIGSIVYRNSDDERRANPARRRD
jgi:SSS family solute:Na+ symporter